MGRHPSAAGFSAPSDGAALPEPAAAIDRQLADLAPLADPMLPLTPVNAAEAWERFQADGFERAPVLDHRPLTVDPDVLKRMLHALPIEAVEDPALGELFRDKRHELDAELDLLLRRADESFLPSSLVLHPGPGDDLVALARRILRAVADTDDVTPLPRRPFGAQEFAMRACEEADHHHRAQPGLEIPVDVRPDVSGLMVDDGCLLVPADLDVAEDRVDALVQHEVGTHVLTWINGSLQPLNLLRTGLAGYEETQEALAVVAEFFVGGLRGPRLATLAARVLGVHCLIEGAGFVETFRRLRSEAPLGRRQAFDITVRVHAGGGYTKDVIYLRGLRRLLVHLGTGEPVAPLLVGKLALDHVPLVDDLVHRDVLVPPTLIPRWLDWPGSSGRATRLRSGLGPADLVPGGSS